MEGDFLKLLGVVGFITFAILLSGFIWDRWFDTVWKGLNVPVTFKEAFLEWAIYVLVFALLSLFLQIALRYACSVC